jgi:hypothetical protein
MLDKDVKLAFGVELGEWESGLAAAKEQLAEATASMKESLISVKEAFGAVGEALVEITAVMGGGKMLGEMVASTVQLNVQSAELGKQFGISSTQASVLKAAMAGAFVTQEQFSAAGARLTRTLLTNEQAIKNLGVATRDSNGNFRPLADIMLDVNSKLMGFKEGTDRGIEAQKIYGKGALELSATFRVTNEAIAEAKVTVDELGLAVTKESEAMTGRYRSAMNGVHEVLEGVSNVIGSAVMPALSAMGEWFRSVGPQVISGFRAAVYTVYAAFEYLKEGIQVGVDIIAGKLSILGAQFRMAGQVADLAMHLDWAGVKAAWAAGTQEIQIQTRAMTEAIQSDMKDAEKARDEFFNKQDQGTPTAAPDPDKKSSAGADQFGKQLEAWQRELDLEYAALKRQHESEMLVYKEQEQAFEKAAGARIEIAEREVEAEARTYGKGSPEYEKAQEHLIEIKRKAGEQLAQMAEAFAKVETDAQIQAIDNQEKALDEQLTKHQITNQQWETAEIALENRKTQILEQGIRDRMQLIDPTQDPVAYAQLCAQIEKLEQEHQNKLMQIRQQAQIKDNQLQQQLFQSIQKDFSQTITKMLQGTESFSQGMRNLFKSLMSSVVEFCSNWIVTWAAAQVKNLFATKASGIGAVTTQAAIAGASGVASAAAAPYPLDLLAPAVGAEMYAAALAYGASAAGGWDVPHGLNPRGVSLHSGEMVLPEALADRIRAVTPNPTGSGRGGGNGASLNLNVNAMDSRSFEKFARRGGSLEKAIKDLHRRMIR